MQIDSVTTENLELVLQSHDDVMTYLDSMPASDRAEVSPDWLLLLKKAEHASPWIHGYAIKQLRDGAEVGRCGFKGPPDADGMVEIAYGIFPGYQGKGYATEAVKALTASVLESKSVSLIRAHTLPSESASTSVLRNCGYRFVGEVDDPEDGRVWRWEYPETPDRWRLCMDDLPDRISRVVDVLAGAPGAIAVVLGGSRALGSNSETSDWDLGLYYRGRVDLTGLAKFGEVYPPGSWGRIMNGGAWLNLDGLRVDVLLRDLDIVEHWTSQADSGSFEVDALLGYLAGAPTYLLTAELSSCRSLVGEIDAVTFPHRLAESAPPAWRFRRSFSLGYARMHANRGNLAGTIGQAAKAVMEEANARACERSLWICNEKQLMKTVAFQQAQSRFSEVPADSSRLPEWVNSVAEELGERTQDRMPFDACDSQ